MEEAMEEVECEESGVGRVTVVVVMVVGNMPRAACLPHRLPTFARLLSELSSPSVKPPSGEKEPKAETT
jgi:hypothetical protein